MRTAVKNMYEQQTALEMAVSRYPSRPFQALQRITLVQGEGLGRMNRPQVLYDVEYLFYLPKVEQLKIPFVNPIEFFWPLPTAPVPSNLTTLELSRV